MKDKIVSMAPFFVIIFLVLGWGATQGWFSAAPAPEPETHQANAAEVEAQRPAPEASAKSDSDAENTTNTTTTAPTPKPDEAAVASWSTYHGDERLAGVAAAALPENPVRRWRFQANGAIYHGPVASAELIHFVTNSGEVFGVNFEGVKAWSRQLTRISPTDQSEKNARVDGPASCFDGTVYVGTMAGIVYALDAATGDVRWKTDIDNTILGAVNRQPATEDTGARLYVIGQDDGSLNCLDAESGKILWTSEAIDRCDGSPSSGPGILAFGSCASALHVISADDGTIKKNISLGTENQVAGGVAIRGESLFSGSHSGEVFHVNWSDGTVVWRNQDALSEVFTTPAVTSDRVVFGSMDDFYYALDRATGEQVWKHEGRGLAKSPVIARDKVVIAAGGVLSLLALDSGKELWSFEVSDEITSPSIINGMIVVGSDDGTVSAFGAP